MQTLLESLVTARKARGLTQGELATRAALSRAAVQQVESGRADPHFSTLLALVEAVDMDVMVVPKALRQELEWFIQAEGKCLGHPPGISRPCPLLTSARPVRRALLPALIAEHQRLAAAA